jgi:hypothetical protein
VHLVVPLLASRTPCAGTLSFGLAYSFAVPHRGDRRARSFVVFQSSLLPAGTNIAGTASDLRADVYFRQSNSDLRILKLSV